MKYRFLCHGPFSKWISSLTSKTNWGQRRIHPANFQASRFGLVRRPPTRRFELR